MLMRSPTATCCDLQTLPCPTISVFIYLHNVLQWNALQNRAKLILCEETASLCCTADDCQSPPLLILQSILDSINLVSALYRIARMFTDVRDSGEREALKQQLLQSSALQLLLRAILGHVLAMSRAPQADLEIRTLVNLVW